MNYKQLLLKYINHVGISEGTTFLDNSHRSEWNDSVEFTDEEWAELQELDRVNFEQDFVNHSCSCHTHNAGACAACKMLGCEVWDFNHVAQPEPDRAARVLNDAFNVGPHYQSMFIEPDKE